MVVILKIPPQAKPDFGGVPVVPDIHIFILDRPPEPLDHDVIERPSHAVHADRDPMLRQQARKRLGGKLAAPGR